jgi:hypothetical protein
VGVECIERIVDVSGQAFDLFSTGQPSDENRPVMSDRAAKVLSRDVGRTHFGYELSWEQILDGARRLLWLPPDPARPKRLVAKLDEATLAAPVALATIHVGQVMDLVDHPVRVTVVRARP